MKCPWLEVLVEDARMLVRRKVVTGGDTISALCLAMTCKSEYKKRVIGPSSKAEAFVLNAAILHDQRHLIEWWPRKKTKLKWTSAMQPIISKLARSDDNLDLIHFVRRLYPQCIHTLSLLENAIEGHAIATLTWIHRCLKKRSLPNPFGPFVTQPRGMPELGKYPLAVAIYANRRLDDIRYLRVRWLFLATGDEVREAATLCDRLDVLEWISPLQ